MRNQTGENNNCAKISGDAARAIMMDSRTSLDIAAEYGVSRPNVTAIKRRKSWRNIDDVEIVKRPPCVSLGESNGSAKLTSTDVLNIRSATNMSQRELGKMFGISQGSVWAVLNRKTWSHV